MRETSSRFFSAILGDHRLMGLYGMAAGALVCLYTPALAMCTTRTAQTEIGPLLLLQLRGHLPMYVGMALGTLVSIVAARRRSSDFLRKVRCFALMAVGMTLGPVFAGSVQALGPGTSPLSPMAIAMLGGMLVAMLVEYVYEHSLSRVLPAQRCVGDLSR